MGIKTVIFEDDHELMDLFREMLGESGFDVSLATNLDDLTLLKADIFIGDYRNKIVPFGKLKSFAQKHTIPLIAISGGEMDYRPHLMKPFHVEDLQSMVFQVLKDAPPRERTASDENSNEESSFFKDAFGFLGKRK